MCYNNTARKYGKKRRRGDMAQLVERRVRNAKVRGSNPLISTTFYQSAPVADWFFIFLYFLLKISMILLFWAIINYKEKRAYNILIAIAIHATMSAINPVKASNTAITKFLSRSRIILFAMH